MSTAFVLNTKTRNDRFVDNVSIGDVVAYEFDLRPWQDDNDTVTSVTWTSEAGSNGVSNTALSSGVASGRITFNNAGRSLFSLLINTATVKKKIWLEVLVKDRDINMDDYGLSA